MPGWLLDLFSEHLARRQVTAADPDALIFVDHDGSGLDYGNWRQRTWLPAIAAAGLPKLQYHDLRRTAATALVQEQIDIKTAQTRLGHSDPRTTLAIYAQATREADRDAAQRLGVRFRPPSSRGVHTARGMDAG